MEIIILNHEYEQKYDEYLLRDEKSLFFASNKYRLLLKKYLCCKDYYLLAVNNGEIIGVLPCFIKENNQYGNILNSLPYYGSNGAVIQHENDRDIKNFLINALKKLCRDHNCVASTIITSPFETDFNFYKNRKYDFIDSRKGLITHLPKQSSNIEQDLFAIFDSKRRRNIKKAKRSDINISVNNSIVSFEFLYEAHVHGMVQIGGKCKEKLFFDTIPTMLKNGIDYDIYIAEKDDKIIAALLLFYFNKTVEYFTPVILDEYRTYQPLCLIVFQAMIDATIRGFEYFNWGGTGISQMGVYNFKKDFGATDYPYYYFTDIYDKSILSLSKETVLENYDNFFVFPFR